MIENIFFIITQHLMNIFANNYLAIIIYLDFSIVNDEHSKKAYSPIKVTEEGIGICVNDEQFEKA